MDLITKSVQIYETFRTVGRCKNTDDQLEIKKFTTPQRDVGERERRGKLASAKGAPRAHRVPYTARAILPKHLLCRLMNCLVARLLGTWRDD